MRGPKPRRTSRPPSKLHEVSWSAFLLPFLRRKRSGAEFGKPVRLPIALGLHSAREPPIRPRSRVDVERLLLGVVLDGVAPELAAIARLAVSAERQLGGSVHEGVDPDRARADPASDANRGVDVRLQTLAERPYSVAFASSTACSRLSNVRATTTGPNTSACEISIEVVTLSTMVGAMKRPFDSSLSPPARTLAPFCSAAADVALDLAEMIGADDRADPRIRVQGVTNLDGLRPLDEAIKELVGNAGMAGEGESRRCSIRPR